MRRPWPSAAAAVLLLLCGRCSGPSPVKEAAGGPAPPDQESWQVRQTVTKGGRLKALVEAGHMARFEASRTVLLDDTVRVTFYDDDGRRPVSRLSALSATIDEGTRAFTAAGRVVLLASDSTRLETDTLRWAEASDSVTGGGRVVIRRREGTETGVGFTASSDLSVWTLRDVMTRLSPSDSAR